MPGKLEFDVMLGTASRAAERRSDDEPMRILVIGDFSGRGVLGIPAPSSLATRRIDPVDIDEFDAVLARIGPTVRLAEGDDASKPIEVRFETLESFHPDSLYQRLPTFNALREMRARLRDPARFEQAAAEMLASGTAPAEASTGAASAGESVREMSERLLGGAPRSPRATNAGPQIDAVIRRLVEPHLVRDPTAGAAPYLAAIDAAIGAHMRHVIAAPAVRSLEASWRSLRSLVERLELGQSLALYVLDASRDELASDLVAQQRPLAECALYRRLVERLEEERPSVLVVDFAFGPAAEDLALLARLGAIGAQLGAPVLAAARPELAGVATLAEHPDPHEWSALPGAAERWQTLRTSPIAPWVGLALPRILLRQPYGARSDEIETFPFEEMTAEAAHEDYLWGNAAFACALLLGTSFQARGWDMEPGDDLEIDDLPAHVMQIDGQSRLKPCAEVCLGERAVASLLEQGLMPFVSYRNRNACRLARFQSVAHPLRALQFNSD